MFREVILPQGVKGNLYLHRMLGRGESLSAVSQRIDGLNISRVLSLASLDEIKVHSPDYYELIQSQSYHWEQIIFPVADFDVPSDQNAFINLLKEETVFLRGGGNLLVHCGAGIGRTGTYAICQLMALGLAIDEAQKVVKAAGSFPETKEQLNFVLSFSHVT